MCAETKQTCYYSIKRETLCWSRHDTRARHGWPTPVRVPPLTDSVSRRVDFAFRYASAKRCARAHHSRALFALVVTRCWASAVMSFLKVAYCAGCGWPMVRTSISDALNDHRRCATIYREYIRSKIAACQSASKCYK